MRTTLKCFSLIYKFKLTRDTKSMLNPYNAKNREVLNENYNIQLPLIEKKRTHKVNLCCKCFICDAKNK